MKIFADDIFSEKVALITGGGTGIGLATALELAGLGARIAICSRKQENLDHGVAALKEAGADVLAAPCNIRDRDQVESFVDRVMSEMGRIDILVNNAGGQFPTLASAVEPKGWNAVVDTNLNGTWNMTQVVATRAMIPQRGGVIVNVILVLGRGYPGVVHSAAARAGVENLTKTLATEWAQFGIRVLCLAPGTIETEGVKQYPASMLDRLREKIPWGRTGTPEEMAQIIAFLSSPAADFATGATFTADGGARLYSEQFPTRKVPDDS